MSYKSNMEIMDNFCKIMSGENKITTKEEYEEWEASYLAMCLLLPEEKFMKMINSLGGIKEVMIDDDKKDYLAEIFKVERRLIDIRINDLIIQEKEIEKEEKKGKSRFLGLFKRK